MVHLAAAAGDEELLDLVDALPEVVLHETERAIRGHLGDYKSSFVSLGQDKKTVCPSNLFHFPS